MVTVICRTDQQPNSPADVVSWVRASPPKRLSQVTNLGSGERAMQLQPVPLRRRRGVKGASASASCKGRCIAQMAGGHGGQVRTGAAGASGAIHSTSAAVVKFQGTAGEKREASTSLELHQGGAAPGAEQSRAQARTTAPKPSPPMTAALLPPKSRSETPACPCLVPESSKCVQVPEPSALVPPSVSLPPPPFFVH